MQSSELAPNPSSRLDNVRCWLVCQSRKHLEAMMCAVKEDSGDNNSQTNDMINEDSFNLISNFESFLVEFQSLLIWENPSKSAYAFTMFTCFYWFVFIW